MPTITAATFDCYGTLIDWEANLGAFLYELARRQGDHDPGPGRALCERWLQIESEELHEGYRRYRTVLHTTLRRWAGEQGYRWNALDGEALERAMEAWQPFPDVVPALRRAKDAGLKLALVSNADHDLLEHTLRHLETDFDEIVTAEDCRAYKPAALLFDSARDRLGGDADCLVHVAGALDLDLFPASDQGFRTAWVNRTRAAAPERRPDHEWPDLWGLAELLELPRGG